jgi:hypothetical protein
MNRPIRARAVAVAVAAPVDRAPRWAAIAAALIAAAAALVLR